MILIFHWIKPITSHLTNWIIPVLSMLITSFFHCVSVNEAGDILWPKYMGNIKNNGNK